jgi:hypothetical protein
MSKTKFKTGDLVARVEAPTVMYRVTSTVGSDAVRVLPYRRQGEAKILIQAGRHYVADGSLWSIAAGDR